MNGCLLAMECCMNGGCLQQIQSTDLLDSEFLMCIFYSTMYYFPKIWKL